MDFWHGKSKGSRFKGQWKTCFVKPASVDQIRCVFSFFIYSAGNHITYQWGACQACSCGSGFRFNLCFIAHPPTHSAIPKHVMETCQSSMQKYPNRAPTAFFFADISRRQKQRCFLMWKPHQKLVCPARTAWLDNELTCKKLRSIEWLKKRTAVVFSKPAIGVRAALTKTVVLFGWRFLVVWSEPQWTESLAAAAKICFKCYMLQKSQIYMHIDSHAHLNHFLTPKPLANSPQTWHPPPLLNPLFEPRSFGQIQFARRCPFVPGICDMVSSKLQYSHRSQHFSRGILCRNEIFIQHTKPGPMGFMSYVGQSHAVREKHKNMLFNCLLISFFSCPIIAWK